MNIPGYFDKVRDYRVQGRCLHELGDILGLTLCGCIADCDDFSEIVDYGEDNIAFLQSDLGLVFPNGIPSPDTLERMVRRLKPSSLQQSFQICLEGLSLAGQHLCIDGKELRGTTPSGKKHALVQMVNVWVEEFKLSFGQQQVEKKSNELTAIPQVLEMVDCQGSVITIDAIGCQKSIVETIRGKQADYIIALKANQGVLYEQVADFMGKRIAQLPSYSSREKNHNRGEERKLYLATAIELVDQAQQWKDLNSLLLVERKRVVGDKIETSIQYYISSLTLSQPKDYERYVRGHWSIENHLHWQLDFTFKEDDNRVRKDNAPANLHLIRNWALHLLYKDPDKISLKRKRKKAARDNQYLLHLLKS
jgi:predicted transposase YbfD/YdcC